MLFDVDSLNNGMYLYDDYKQFYKKQKDGTVDFIYKIHRTLGKGDMPNNDGYEALSARRGTGLVDTVNNIIADRKIFCKNGNKQ